MVRGQLGQPGRGGLVASTKRSQDVPSFVNSLVFDIRRAFRGEHLSQKVGSRLEFAPCYMDSFLPRISLQHQKLDISQCSSRLHRFQPTELGRLRYTVA